MGHRFEDPEIQKDIPLVPFKAQKGKDGGVEVKLGEEWKRPEEISAQILAKIKADVEAKLGEKSNRGNHNCSSILR
jgi:molecular chaperone DnaK